MIKQGSTVKVHYIGKIGDEVFDSSEGKDPIEFVVGTSQVITGFENAVIGLKEGDVTNVSISPEDGYGESREDLILSAPLNSVPPEIQVGHQLQGTDNNGQPFNVIVKEIGDDVVLLDANHPLSGKILNFEIQVVSFV